MRVKQIDGHEIEQMLWPADYCEKARANLFSLTCKLSQGAKMSSNKTKNIELDISDGWMVLNGRIKTRDGWVAGVNQKQSKELQKKL